MNSGEKYTSIDKLICMRMNMLSYIYTNIALSGRIQNSVEAYSFMRPATLYLCKLSIFIYSGISGQKKIEDTSLPCQFLTPKDLTQRNLLCWMNT